jgi:hypothetical protein
VQGAVGKRMLELAYQAAVEQDNSGLVALIRELNQLLEPKPRPTKESSEPTST